MITVFKVALPDEIYLKNGSIIKNVVVKDTLENKLQFVTSSGDGFDHCCRSILLSRIDSVVRKPFDKYKPSGIENENNFPSQSETRLFQEPVQPPRSLSYPNIILLPVSILSFGLAWDYFEQVDDIGETIDNFKKVQSNTSSLETTKSRKTILGIGFLIVGVLNTVISLQSVEVNASENSIKLSYKF